MLKVIRDGNDSYLTATLAGKHANSVLRASCQLCSHGPCRWIPDKELIRVYVVSGPDGNAMRKLLIQNTLGAGTYSHHAYEAFRTLKAIGKGESPFKIKDEKKLRWMCEKLGIDSSQDINKLAVQLADLLEAQQHVGVEDRNLMVEALHLRRERKSGKSFISIRQVRFMKNRTVLPVA